MEQDKRASKGLEALVVDDAQEAVDLVLHKALEPYLRFTRDGRMVSREPFLRLSDPTKLLVHLLGRLAMVRLKLPNSAAAASADLLHNECGVPLKSCREYLSRYKGRGLLDKDQDGYLVPTWAVSDVALAISKNAE